VTNVTNVPTAQNPYMRSLLADPGLPGGTALAVALAVAVKIRWGNPSTAIPVQAIADRLGVEKSYAVDVVSLMCGLGYLCETAAKRDRKMYMATMPTKQWTDDDGRGECRRSCS
jgi:hypothetical protein